MYDRSVILRPDETWHRLREWTSGQTPSERLAAQLLAEEGYSEIDPSHPLGGPDGGRDGQCKYGTEKSIFAVYFPRGQQTFATIKSKLKSDLESASKHSPDRLVFFTNQELTLSERSQLRSLAMPTLLDLFHLERISAILDRPRMYSVREQYLNIFSGPPPILVEASINGVARQFADDQELFDRLVQMHEAQVRKKSDAAHARVEKERVEREQAEQRKGPFNFGQPLSDIHREDILLPARVNSAYWWLPEGEPNPPEPLTDEGIEDLVVRYRSELENRWVECQDYLAGVAWPAIQFEIKNAEKSFLKNVQVIMTFHGVRAVKFEELMDFYIERLDNPSWRPYRSPLDGPDLSELVFHRDDEPITWMNNDEGNLEVTITLPMLRPHPKWRSSEDDEQIVLVVPLEYNEDSVNLTYTVTAEGYGEVFEGDPIRIPVISEAMLEVLRTVIKANKD